MFQRIKNIYHLLQAVIANIVYGFPAKKVKIIGVTGTDGKTTTVSIIYHILKTSGKKVSMITSVGAYIDDKVSDIGFHVTTPSSFGLQKYLKRAVSAGAEYVVLETTSHALDQNRVWGIPYTVAVLTNITHEHLDYHKTYASYAKTKSTLFTHAPYCVLNMDDESYHLLTPKLEGKKIATFSLLNPHADFTKHSYPFFTHLLGTFNTMNCLAAVAATKALGIPDTAIKTALKTFVPPAGRQEIVYDREFRVMVDFAHTPNAFAKLLPEVRAITKGRVIHVFGSAGKRDVTKRPSMGKESSRFADVMILTAEDPRNEKIADINHDIRQGVRGFAVGDHEGAKPVKNKTLFEIPDRRKAIGFAIAIAQKGDTVILTGKSHEKSMNLGHGEQPWDEFAVVKDALSHKS
jgi:UDP-N-acetylmuramoyl-L-alanyl-D-glutamate--2,6-diaminopimelate ligase